MENLRALNAIRPWPADVNIPLPNRPGVKNDETRTIGRMLTDINTQTLGVHFSDTSAVGRWPRPANNTDRAVLEARQKLLDHFLPNMLELEGSSRPDKLEAELTFHFHKFTEREKVLVLDQFAGGNYASDHPRLMSWIDRTFYTMPFMELERIKQFSSSETKGELAPQFDVVERFEGKAGAFDKYVNNNLIDTLFNHRSYLRAHPAIAEMTSEAQGKKVLIVGMGLGGAQAAFELNKAGVEVAIIEGTGKTGGRLSSERFTEVDPDTGFERPATPSIGERGAMRIPPTGELAFHYVESFRVRTDPNFPNPGTVPTKLYFEGEVIEWPAGGEPQHPLAQKVFRDWKALVTPLVQEFQEARARNDVGGMIQAHQRRLDMLEHFNFKEGTLKLIQEHNSRVPEHQKIVWGTREMQMFGAIGVGTGGFGPLFNIAAMEIVRVVVNALEDNQHLFPDGQAAFAEKFFTEAPVRSDGVPRPSLQEQDVLRLNTELVGLPVPTEDGKQVKCLIKNEHGHEVQEVYDFVIHTGQTIPTSNLPREIGADPVMNRLVNSAIANAHLVNSSKLFIKIKGRPEDVENSGKIRAILSDRSQHLAIVLAYPGSKHSVVLLAYGWEAKSQQLASLPEAERLKVLKAQTAEVDPEFAERLVPVGNNVMVDWQTERLQGGAFKLDYPGSSGETNTSFRNFNARIESGVMQGQYPRFVLAGDSVSFTGGWQVGALETANNAACAAARAIGMKLPADSPLEQKQMYNYDIPHPIAA